MASNHSKLPWPREGVSLGALLAFVEENEAALQGAPRSCSLSQVATASLHYVLNGFPQQSSRSQYRLYSCILPANGFTFNGLETVRNLLPAGYLRRRTLSPARPAASRSKVRRLPCPPADSAGLSTGEVCYRIINPATQARRCAFVEILREKHGSDSVGAATVFVSHAWGNPFLDLVKAVATVGASSASASQRQPPSAVPPPGDGSAAAGFRAASETTTYLWIDIFTARARPGAIRSGARLTTPT